MGTTLVEIYLQSSQRAVRLSVDNAGMSSAAPAVEVNRIGKRYSDGPPALTEVSFVAHRGEVTGLLGPNGAGKTTLIRIVTTILAPTTGTFDVLGLSPRQSTQIRAGIGVMPESAGYPKRKRGVDYLTYHGRLFGLAAEAAQHDAMRLLDQVGLAGRAGDRIGTYSRGMRQRLGLARALINDPEVLFLDEPTLGLDPSGKRDILDLIRQLADERGAAVILTSHLLDEIERVCDRAVILKDGVVVFDASVTAGLADTFLAATS